jgi:tetratricopeptide (TPR) repeat protein
LVLQLGLQFAPIKPQAQELRLQWLRELSESAGALRAVQTEGGERGTAVYRDVAQRHIHESRSDLARHLDELRRLVGELPRARDIKLLLVLDTFERVQGVSFEFTRALWDFMNYMQPMFPLMRVIVAGRARLSKAIAHRPYELKELDEEAAKGYLAWRGVTNPQLAEAIFKRVGGDPLSLRLTVDGLQQDHGNLASLTTLPTDFDELSVDHELNQGWLYRRYLSRIRDPQVQRLAHPGLVLRRVDPALIRQVLAIPCKVAVPSDEVAEDLFERLAQQASLVTREGQWTLRHRTDVRKRMLRALVQTEGGAVFDIHRRAVDFYAQQPPSSEARAEEIYHRLFIARSRDEIDTRWMQGIARLLRDAVDEIPLEMRSYLIAKLKTTSAAFDWNEADARSKEDFMATRAQDALAVNRLTDALRMLTEIRDRLPGSKLYRLEAQALERLGRYAEACIVTNEGLFSARRAGDVELELDLLLIALRANETLGQYERAGSLLDEAERLDVKLKTPLQAEFLGLELRMHRLRLCRLDPANCGSDISTLRQAAYVALESLFEIAARQNAIVLLDTVEEIGVEQPEAVARAITAFRSVFDAETNQRQIARLLREWRETLGGRRSPSTDVLLNSAQFLESGQRDQAMQAAGLMQTNEWAEFFRRLFKTYTPTQPLVSGLVGLVRTTLIGAQQPATETSALLQQTVTALFSAFETLEELQAFLKEEFPNAAAGLTVAASYHETLLELATVFERQGQTETLIARALTHQPDNSLLHALQQQLQMVTDDAPAASSPPIVGGDRVVGGRDVVASGTLKEVVGGRDVVISGSIKGSVIVGRDIVYHNFNRSILREQLNVLPKTMPPFSTAAPADRVWVPPELVFNWALGMRLAMRAVCLVEAAQAMGTAFLVAPNLLLYATGQRGKAPWNNWREVRFRFDHHHVPDGSLGNPTVYIPAEDWLAAWNEDLGYTLVRLEGMPGMDLVPGEGVPRGWLSLTAVPVAAGQSLCMLHHGLGGPQMLEYASARPAREDRIELATLSGRSTVGASGAPCCNEAWQVVAVRIGTGRSQPASPPLMVIWARDLLADTKFAETLRRHLPEAQSGETDQAARLARLRQTLVDSFSFEELHNLAFDLNVDWDNLQGATRSEKARSLVAYANTVSKLDALVQHGMALRPHVEWG